MTHFTGCPFSSAEAIAAWDGFVAMRKKKGKAMTDRARELIVADLIKMGEADAVKALNNSTRGGWTDVYPPKPEQRHSAPSGSFPPMDRNAPVTTKLFKTYAEKMATQNQGE